MEPILDELIADPSVLFHRIVFHKNEARFFRVPPELPNKACQVKGLECIRVPLQMLGGADRLCNSQVLPPMHFIWITDFCGSTLYARALNEVRGLYLYNETSVFGDLAIAKRLMDAGTVAYPIRQWRYLLRLAMLFYTRTVNRDDTALIKEWPLSNYILHEILGTNPRFRGIFLHSSLRQYLLKCLTRPERRALAKQRCRSVFHEMSSMPALQDIRIDRLVDEQYAALHWLYLMYWHHQQDYANHPQLRCLDSDDFFAAPAKCLVRSAEFFGRSLSEGAAEQIVSGPVFTHHSKRSRTRFSMDDHQASFDRAEEEVGEETNRALEWARKITDRHPLPASPGRDLLE